MRDRDGASAFVTERNRRSAANWKSVPLSAVSMCNTVRVLKLDLLDLLVRKREQ